MRLRMSSTQRRVTPVASHRPAVIPTTEKKKHRVSMFRCGITLSPVIWKWHSSFRSFQTSPLFVFVEETCLYIAWQYRGIRAAVIDSYRQWKHHKPLLCLDQDINRCYCLSGCCLVPCLFLTQERKIAKSQIRYYEVRGQRSRSQGFTKFRYEVHNNSWTNQGRFQGGGQGGAPPVKFVPPVAPQKTFKIRPHQASEQKANAALVVILNVF